MRKKYESVLAAQPFIVVGNETTYLAPFRLGLWGDIKHFRNGTTFRILRLIPTKALET